jgi:hypothetical protein
MNRRWLPGLVGGLAVILSACSPSATASPSASATASASVEPSATSDTPEASEAPAALPQRGEVAVDGLELFAGPDGGGSAVAALPRGASVLLLEAAADPDWVLVMGLDGDLGDELSVPFGWTAERDGAATRITRVAADCPAGAISVDAFRTLQPADGLVCYGGTAREVVGWLVEGCGAGASPRSGEPEWLNGTFSSVPVSDTAIPPGGAVPDDIIFLRASPGVTASTCSGIAAGWYRFAGHFDDPASTTCATTTSADGTTMETVDPALAAALCRLRYAITSLTATTAP